MTQFKEGDRVVYKKGTQAEDSGTVISYDVLDDKVWVKWDSDGSTQYARVDDLSFSDQSGDAESAAVMLLLSLGYTITKNQKD